MGYIFRKSIAIIVLSAFLSLIIVLDYSFGLVKNEFEEAREFYKNGDYDKAIQLFNRFIEKFKENTQFKDKLIEAYYYKAKIYFFGGEENELVVAFSNLFELDPTYNFSPDEDPSFIEKAKKIQIEVKKDGIVTGNIIHGEKILKPKKKKFPVLFVVGAAVVTGVIAFLLLKKKPDRTLNVTVGEGAEGTPSSGSYTYKSGNTISYNYTLRSGYTGLSVKLDGADVASSGTIKMDANHTLTVSATKTYTLTVSKGTGVDGTPASGATSYNADATVNYSYTLQSGYTDLVVTLDGTTVASSGTITMNRDHTLTVTAGKTYTLTVTKGVGVNGTPDTGTFSYRENQTVSYGYTLQNGYSNLVVTIDGAQSIASGTITMDRDHTIVVTAILLTQYTLTVTKGEGVSGTPDSGIFTYRDGETKAYNYSLMTGYRDLVVTLDGNLIGNDTSANGTITMNANHTLTASATKVYTLTVIFQGAGIYGTPNEGTHSYKEGTLVNYNYDSSSNLVFVYIDGHSKSKSGIVTMNGNHIIVVKLTPDLINSD